MRLVKFFLTLVVLLIPLSAFAHFGLVIPSENTAESSKDKNLNLLIGFIHPMEMKGMDMEKPQEFGVVVAGKKENLTATLKPFTYLGHKAWTSSYTLKRPGVYQFFSSPVPYFEPAEDIYILHYTKTYVAAYGAEEGWDEAIGLPTEIIPLTRPFGLYAGNTFQGQVLLKGKPVANCEVEVEFFNQKQKVKAPGEYYITQVVKTDKNGIFTYTPPAPGWWGFSALNTADYKLKGKDVELGAVLWLYFAPFGK
ncbi:MAG: nickel transport protein [Desulfonauticus sp.]|nr:nickel transport protein [Desulfonauticus sp.]